MSYVITTESRRADETLFMVDRRRERRSFWSNRLDDVFTFSDRGAAERKANSLRFNKPRVITMQEASKIEAQQIPDDDSEMDFDGGWDERKGWTFR